VVWAVLVFLVELAAVVESVIQAEPQKQTQAQAVGAAEQEQLLHLKPDQVADLELI
jgi:hypothetical protein